MGVSRLNRLTPIFFILKTDINQQIIKSYKRDYSPRHQSIGII